MKMQAISRRVRIDAGDDTNPEDLVHRLRTYAGSGQRHLVLVDHATYELLGNRRTGLAVQEHVAVIEVMCDLRAWRPTTLAVADTRPLFANIADALDVIDATLCRRGEFDGMAPEEVLASLIEFAGERPYASLWMLAYLAGQACGLVLPSVLHDGTIMGLGVVPGARNSGLGTALHGAALDVLRRQGACRYVDHIDADSFAMRRICSAHGCREARLLHQFRIG